MSRLGDISRDAMRNAISLLQGRGGYSDDESGPRNAELTGIAYAYAAAAEKVEEAFRESIPGLSSSLIDEWEKRFGIGDQVGRTEAQRVERLRYFFRLAKQVTTTSLRESLKSIDPGAYTDRVSLAEVANGRYHSQLMAYTGHITMAVVSAHVMRMVREFAERGISPNDWPLHIRSNFIRYQTAMNEGEAAFDSGGTIDTDFDPQFYGPQFHPGKSELAEDLNGIYDSLFQSKWLLIDANRALAEDPVGIQMIFDKGVIASTTATLDDGVTKGWSSQISASTKEGWNSRIVVAYGRYSTSASQWKVAGASGTYIKAVGYFSATGATTSRIEFFTAAGAGTGIFLECDSSAFGTGGRASLKLVNTNGSARYVQAWVRASPSIHADASSAYNGGAYKVRKGQAIKFSAATDGLGEDLDILRQWGPVWEMSANSGLFGSDPYCIRRYGVINNMRKPASGTAEYTLDSSINWGNRYVLISWGFRVSQANGTSTNNLGSHYPGAATQGVNDTLAYGRRGLSPGSNPHLVYLDAAGTGYPLYSDDSDTTFLGFTGVIKCSGGKLVVTVPSADSHLFKCISMSFLIHATCRIDQAETRDFSISYSPGNNIDPTDYRKVCDPIAMLPLHEPVPRFPSDAGSAIHDFSADTNRSLTMPTGPITAGQGHVPTFVERRLRLGTKADHRMLVRQNNWGEVFRVFSFQVVNGADGSIGLANFNTVAEDRNFSGAKQVDMRDRICHLACIASSSSADLYDYHAAVSRDDFRGVHFYSWVEFGKGQERTIFADLWGISGLDLVIQGLRSPNHAELVLRNNTGVAYYFTGQLWASPQLGCADTRR